MPTFSSANPLKIPVFWTDDTVIKTANIKNTVNFFFKVGKLTSPKSLLPFSGGFPKLWIPTHFNDTEWIPHVVHYGERPILRSITQLGAISQHQMHCLVENCSVVTFSWKMSFFNFLQFLAHLVMSQCNHALSVMWCCHCHQHQCWCWHWCLCTALPVTALIIETSYLANICSYTPSICTWNIRSIWRIFFKWQPF